LQPHLYTSLSHFKGKDTEGIFTNWKHINKTVKRAKTEYLLSSSILSPCSAVVTFVILFLHASVWVMPPAKPALSGLFQHKPPSFFPLRKICIWSLSSHW
jgi:hypothetical protein